MPRGGDGKSCPLIAFTQQNGPWIQQNGDAGHLFNNTVVYSGNAWYTACGWRSFMHGNFGCVQLHADIWFSTTGNTDSYNLYSTAEDVAPTAKASRAYAFPVRCVRE